MTQKTGQKCTATRRILVPEDRVDEVAKDLMAELARVKIGDPSARENRMGPLSSPRQFEDVKAGIAQLQEHAETLTGGPEAIAETGCFVAPTLLRANDPEDEIFHSLEVFGPCATILAYDGSAAEAVRLVSKGGGGLVTSAYVNDNEWATAYTLGVAPWHGRVWLANERSAEQSLPPGMVLPQMVHGGPGRAGGGEELGGLRGLSEYLQRTAVQGFGGLLKDAFGE
jgi:oxepin-CoA hydrolase/3-oxo-5,6-dehydrosuberyl-CoA semialdehyde dehydrogenase